MPTTNNGPVRLAYEVRGEGETLILSSGLGGTGDYWAPQIEQLAQRFRVITYDHAGTGRSTRPVGPRSLEEFAADMKAVIRASGAGSAHVMGHAIGGITGLQLALDAPRMIDSLVIVNGWGAPDPHLGRCFDMRTELLRCSGLEAYLEAQPIFLYPATWVSARDSDMRRSAARAPERIPVEADLLSRIEAFRHFAPSDKALAAVEAPVLCLATRDDMLVPWTASERLAERLGNARFELLPWGGHASSHSAPDTFQAALDGFYADLTRELVQ